MENPPSSSPHKTPFLPGEGEEQVARILESITDGFCALDAEWRFTFLNEAAKRLLAPHVGDPAMLLGRILWDTIPDTRGTELEREYRRAVAEGVAVELDYFNPSWNAWFAVRGFPIRGDGLSIYFRDVTREREAAETLRASEERYRVLFDSIDEGFAVFEMVWDADGRARDYFFWEVNPAFEKQTGLVNAKGRSAREMIPELEEHWFETYGEVVRTGRAHRFVQHSEPMGRWFDVYAFPLGAGPERRVAVLFTDVTARRCAEGDVERLGAEARARVAELETLLEVLPVGIGIAEDRLCQKIRVNPMLARMLGISSAANASTTAPESERPLSFRVLDDAGRELPGPEQPMQVAALEGRELRDLELCVVREDGRQVRLLEYAAPLFDEHGETRGSVGVFVDISERQRIEERQRFLLRLDEEVRPLSDPDAIVAAAARLLGEHLKVERCAYANIEEDEDTMDIIGDFCRGVRSIVGRYRLSDFGSAVVRLMLADEPCVVEDIDTHQPRPEALDAYRATSIRAMIGVPLHKGGKFVATMAVHQTKPRRWTPEDVSLTRTVANRCWEAIERARITRVLGESEQRFRTLADHIAQLAWMADAAGWIFWYNKRWFDYTGTTLEEMQGWGWKRVQHPAELPRVEAKWQQYLAAGEAWEDTFPLRSAEGDYRWFLSRAVPIRDEEGNVTRWFGTNTDVTEHRAAIHALARAKEEAEAANRAKDDFLAALSHELRTPLTPVLLSAAALQEEERLPADVRAQLAMIRRNIELEARLIDDLLDITRIARGKLAIRMQDCEAHSLIQLALEIVQDEANARRLHIELQLHAQRSQFQGDPARVQQVIWNLLKNAVKFTPPGGRIIIRSENYDGRLVIEVSDNGLGIAPETIKQIFLPFEQAGLANNHRFGGLGLGLSISKAIVAMHGGTIAAHSAGLQRGATFRVELPSIATPAPAPSAPAAPLAPVPSAPAENVQRILLVEDHDATLAVLTRLLKRAGYHISPASSVAAARELAAGEPFDLVISDIGLPDGTGIELMASLRQAHGLRGIALTGYGMEEDIARSREAGFLAHLTKPVDFAQLCRAIEAIPAATPASAAPSIGPDRARWRSLRKGALKALKGC